jgi:hypothetical protein
MGHTPPARHRCNAGGWNCYGGRLSRERLLPGRRWAWNRWPSVPAGCGPSSARERRGFRVLLVAERAPTPAPAGL